MKAGSERRLLHAALVIARTPTIWLWLKDHDPNALAQLEAAIAEQLAPADDCPECARSYGPHYRGPCEH